MDILRVRLLVATSLLLLAIACSGGGDGGDDRPRLIELTPEFITERPSTQPGDIYLVGTTVDSSTIELDIMIDYLFPLGPSFGEVGAATDFSAILRMDPVVLEPIAIVGGDTWPKLRCDGFVGNQPSHANIASTAIADEWLLTAGLIAAFPDACVAPCVIYINGPTHMATLTVRVNQPGTHDISWVGPGTIFSCDSFIDTDHWNPHDYPAFGGVVVAP